MGYKVSISGAVLSALYLQCVSILPEVILFDFEAWHFSISMPVQQHNSLYVLDRLVMLGSQAFEDFLQCFLESIPSFSALEKMPVNHLQMKQKSKTSFTLSSRSHIFLPTALQNAILAFRPHPSCLYKWLVLCYLCRENPVFDESAAVQISRCNLSAGNPRLISVGQQLVSEKINLHSVNPVVSASALGVRQL